ncbi:tetraspanin-9 isoform X1 [Pan paniscus]|nr:tetraspanin-9 isoform X1 [Pan paniscus]
MCHWGGGGSPAGPGRPRGHWSNAKQGAGPRARGGGSRRFQSRESGPGFRRESPAVAAAADPSALSAARRGSPGPAAAPQSRGTRGGGAPAKWWGSALGLGWAGRGVPREPGSRCPSPSCGAASAARGELTPWKEKSNCSLPKDAELRGRAGSRGSFASAQRAAPRRAAEPSRARRPEAGRRPTGSSPWARGSAASEPRCREGACKAPPARPQPAPDLGAPSVPFWERCPPLLAPPGNAASMEKSSSEDSSIHRSPSLDSKDSDFAKPSTSGRPFGRGFTAGAFYGTAGSRGQSRAEAGVKTDKYNAPKGSKYVVFYLDLSFVFLLEFKKCNMARGCLCCLKYMMFLFNLIFWLCGCGLLGVGIWLSVSQGNFATFSPSFPSLSAANLVIAIGTIVMVTGFLGCLGAIKENKCLLLSFFIVLLVILLAELILLILFFVYMDKVNENAKKDLKEGLLLYHTENNVGLKNAWNIIQAEMRCCGVTDYTDWYPVLGENTVPDRCCMENSQGCGRNATTPLWRTGCYEKLKMWFDDNKHVLGTVGMCILIMQILGMAFSMTLFQHIHRTGKKYDA